MLKITLVLVKNVFFGLKKGIRRLLSQIAANHTAANTTPSAKINEVKGETLSITNLVTTSGLNVKINEVKNKIPNTANLATTTTLAAFENEIPNISNLVKRTDRSTKISEIENKIATDHDQDRYIATQEFNKLTSENFSARLAQEILTSNGDIANFVKKTDLMIN